MEHALVYTGLLTEKNGRLLLLRHQDESGVSIYTAPCAPVQGHERVRDIARREAFSKTGLLAEPQQLIYVEEFREPQRGVCLWFKGELVDEDAIPSHLDGENIGYQAVWLGADEIKAEKVRPVFLPYDYWRASEAGFAHPRYLIR